MRINSLYICVKDMARAIDFYEHFFARKVDVEDRIYSVFIIDGFRFGLFAYLELDEAHVFGSNCLPSIEIDDVARVAAVLREFERPIVFPLTKIGGNMVFEFEDTEGNHVEMTYPSSLSKRAVCEKL